MVHGCTFSWRLWIVSSFLSAIDHFCEALHMLPYYFHIFAIPLLMTNCWRKQLLKVMDFNFVVKPCTEIWGASQHEPLGVFI
jgi:hypothetical protein